ncbi:MAG: hypothetical protein M0Z68_03345 [Gammaproteobacteria bacterium]|nr:hypothetical protein [Gammaproteobacteria bacterium]
MNLFYEVFDEKPVIWTSFFAVSDGCAVFAERCGQLLHQSRIRQSGDVAILGARGVLRPLAALTFCGAHRAGFCV